MSSLPTQGLQGPAGPHGPPGEASIITGPIGAQGAQGIPGNAILYGTANPLDSVGIDGNFYINKTTHFMFGPKVVGSWPPGVSLIGPQGIQGPQGVQGPQGIPGNTILYGASDPVAGTGVDGNFYINTATNFMFGPKAGVWPTGLSLIGPRGPQGIPGIQGPPGTATGTVSGPAGAVADDIATYGNAAGTLIKDGGKKISDLVLKGGDTMTGPLVLNADPTVALGASTKQYTDGKVAAVDLSSKVSKGGDTMTGPLTLNADPTAPLHAATKQYTDNRFASVDLSSKVSKSGDTMGALTVNGQFTAGTNYIRFGSSGSAGYLQWNGGSSYYLGNAGYLWHTGNLNWANYVSNGRIAYLGDPITYNGMTEPWGGGVITGIDYTGGMARFRQMQFYTSGWYALGYA